MAKFAIACPRCGKYAEGKTGFFARKKIECSCGNVIDVRTDKLTSIQCPHCKNQVVFDQTKGPEAVCPVCHGKINIQAARQALDIVFHQTVRYPPVNIRQRIHIRLSGLRL